MKRILFSVSCLGLLSLGSCGNSSTENAAADGGATGTEATGANTADTEMASASTMPSSDTSAAMATDGPTAPHSTDPEFMMSAAHSDQNEIQLSKMALEKGVTGMAKDHANQMITDHTKSTADLKPIAQKKGVTLPTDMDAEHKAIAAQMKNLSGKEFETKYMAQMLLDHQKTVNTMMAHKQMTQDADLQGFITKTTPVVQAHLAMFKQHAGSAAGNM
ncbi:DUF4142 domain-containing protein [Hymenobacter sp. 5516J-16]|uniref:DUF4142 domain-containing protein n=1 Tax=Hymenobacter sublimis TaxID=2933777 RepID=A0ABY4J8V5_9BACT|nr:MULTISPECIES: DUF4142 domain-containing protein [Hymenobacter]UOQ75567.1 DUF4142 domain-containing protein [Hymenobacter sp. 5516J-16]UPL49235.1 DUF4142 domain-containing protein [Hymenobacter sublimis]